MKQFFFTTIFFLVGASAFAQAPEEKKEDSACVVQKLLLKKTESAKIEFATLQSQYKKNKSSNTPAENLKLSRAIDEKQFYLNQDSSELTFASMTCDFSKGITRFRGTTCPEGLDAIARSSTSDADSDEILCQKRDSALISNIAPTENVTKIGDALRVEGPPGKVSFIDYEAGKPE